MAQVKKRAKREAIFESATRLFQEKGYLRCRMEEIAVDAGTAVANIYVYFPSKLHLFYEVWTAMIEARMHRIASDVSKLDDSRDKLRCVFLSLWRDIPDENNYFARNLIAAIVTAPDHVEKPHEILEWCERFLEDLVVQCLPKERHFVIKEARLSFLSWMVFDGFVVNAGRNETDKRDMNALVDYFVDRVLLGV